MPSPFPGMDPYLESPDIWPDFHDRIASEISTTLNRELPATYYARLETRPEVGIIGEAPHRRIVADVSVNRADSQESSNLAVADVPRADISESVDLVIETENIRHHYVEVRDSQRGHELVTLIEIVSPSNKRAGTDRNDYVAKQREVLGSDASLVEIDLLRTGNPIIGGGEVIDALINMEPRVQYAAGVCRAWRRDRGTAAYQLFPFTLREPLPCIPIPLREGEAEVPLDLQYVFRQVYDGGPYRRGAVDYARPPQPPLNKDDDIWAAECVKQSGKGK